MFTVCWIARTQMNCGLHLKKGCSSYTIDRQIRLYVADCTWVCIQQGGLADVSQTVSLSVLCFASKRLLTIVCFIKTLLHAHSQ